MFAFRNEAFNSSDLGGDLNTVGANILFWSLVTLITSKITQQSLFFFTVTNMPMLSILVSTGPLKIGSGIDTFFWFKLLCYFSLFRQWLQDINLKGKYMLCSLISFISLISICIMAMLGLWKFYLIVILWGIILCVDTYRGGIELLNLIRTYQS